MSFSKDDESSIPLFDLVQAGVNEIARLRMALHYIADYEAASWLLTRDDLIDTIRELQAMARASLEDTAP